MSELEQFRAMLSGHHFTEEPLDEEEAPGYTILNLRPDVHKEVTIGFTFDDDGDLSSIWPRFPENWRAIVARRASSSIGRAADS